MVPEPVDARDEKGHHRIAFRGRWKGEKKEKEGGMEEGGGGR